MDPPDKPLSPSSIVTLCVGGQEFATTVTTLRKDPDSMLARMFSGDMPSSRLDSKGRFFIDRDPKHFGVILNWLRDGTAVLPDGDAAVDELLQEAEFYQLRGLAAAAATAGVSRPEPLTAQMLRESVAAQLQSQPRIAAALDVLLACAFGAGVRDGNRRGAQQAAAALCWNSSSSSCSGSGSFPSPQYAWAANAAAAAAASSAAAAFSNRIPPRQAAVDVVLREAAFCPLSPQPKRAIARDEALYVGFRQEIRVTGAMHTESYEAKHEAHLVHEGGALSYDARAYGVPQEDRLRIKTAAVYRHHCVSRLPPRPARLRRVAFAALASPDALLWALELCGFRDVGLKVHAHQATVDAGEAADGGWGEEGAEEGRCCFEEGGEEARDGPAAGRDCLGGGHHGGGGQGLLRRQQQRGGREGSSPCRGWCAGGGQCTCGGAAAAAVAPSSSSSPPQAAAFASAPSFEFDALPAAEALTSSSSAAEGNAGSATSASAAAAFAAENSSNGGGVRRRLSRLAISAPAPAPSSPSPSPTAATEAAARASAAASAAAAAAAAAAAQNNSGNNSSTGRYRRGDSRLQQRQAAAANTANANAASGVGGGIVVVSPTAAAAAAASSSSSSSSGSRYSPLAALAGSGGSGNLAGAVAAAASQASAAASASAAALLPSAAVAVGAGAGGVAALVAGGLAAVATAAVEAAGMHTPPLLSPTAAVGAGGGGGGSGGSAFAGGGARGNLDLGGASGAVASPRSGNGNGSDNPFSPTSSSIDHHLLTRDLDPFADNEPTFANLRYTVTMSL